MKLSLAIQTPEVPGLIPVALLSGSLEDKLAKAADWGADGIELMTSNPREANPQLIKNLCQNYGLLVAAVGSGAIPMVTGFTLLNIDNSKAEHAEAILYDLIDFAKMVEAPIVTIGSFRGKLAGVGDGGRYRLAKLLKRAADYAQKSNILLALEALNRYEGDFINNHREGLAFLDEVKHPAIGLLLDTYHVNIEESSYTEPFLRTYEAGKLFHVHLGDNNRLPPGYGLINFSAVVNTLRNCGYSGYLSAELLTIPDPDTAARDTLTYMRHILEEKA